MAMDKIKLENRTRQPWELTEYHQYVCARRGECTCRVVHHPGVGGKMVPEYQPRSVRIGPLETVEVDAAILASPHAADLVKAGKLRRIELEKKES